MNLMSTGHHERIRIHYDVNLNTLSGAEDV
jgi:hypothetical protein